MAPTLLSTITHSTSVVCGPGSVVDIATGYGLEGPGIEFLWGRDFAHLSRQALRPTHPLVQWVPGLIRGKERPGREAEPSSLLVPWSRKSIAIPLLPLWAVRSVQRLSACTRVHFTFTSVVYFRFLPTEISTNSQECRQEFL